MYDLKLCGQEEKLSESSVLIAKVKVKLGIRINETVMGYWNGRRCKTKCRAAVTGSIALRSTWKIFR